MFVIPNSINEMQDSQFCPAGMLSAVLELGSSEVARKSYTFHFVDDRSNLFDVDHLVEIRHEFEVETGKDQGWGVLEAVIDTLVSHGALLKELARVGLHFRSSTVRGTAPLADKADEKHRRAYLSRVLSVTESLRTNEHQYTLEITIDKTNIGDLLSLLTEDDEDKTNEPNDGILMSPQR